LVEIKVEQKIIFVSENSRQFHKRFTYAFFVQNFVAKNYKAARRTVVQNFGAKNTLSYEKRTRKM